jgi:Ni,Fe-hydrogenase maturation factor
MDWIVGIGNALRGDDGLGPAAVESLTPELAEGLATADRVLFIDARVAADVAELRPIAPRPARGLGHALSPEGILELTERAFGRAPEGWLLSIPGRSFGVGDGLSPDAAGHLEDAGETIRQWLSGTAVIAHA